MTRRILQAGLFIIFIFLNAHTSPAEEIPAVCAKLEDEQKELCIARSAVRWFCLNDPEEAQCYIRFALQEDDSIYCHLISRDHPWGGGLESSCLMKLALQKSDISRCEGDTLCIRGFARGKKDVTICDLLKNQEEKELCIMSLGIESGDRNICDLISTSHVKTSCLFNLESDERNNVTEDAVKTGSIEKCNALGNGRESCYYKFDFSSEEFLKNSAYSKFWLKLSLFYIIFSLLFVFPAFILYRQIVKYDFGQKPHYGILLFMALPLLALGEQPSYIGGIFNFARGYPEEFTNSLLTLKLLGIVILWNITILLHFYRKKNKALRILEVVLAVIAGFFILQPILYVIYFYGFGFLSAFF